MNKTDVSKMLWEAINEHGLDEVTRIMSETVVGGDKPEPEPGHRFYVGQPVMMANYGQPLIWVKTTLGRIENNKFYDKNNCSWFYCKPDHEAPSLINWVEHTGDKFPEKAKGNRVLAQKRNGSVMAEISSAFIWGHTSSPSILGYDNDIMRYAIIPEIEWLDGGEE